MPHISRLLLIGASVLLALPIQAAPRHDKGAHASPNNEEVRVEIGAPRIDIGQIRITLGEHRQWLEPSSPLPPGIRNKLGRGKPLPPGIAKRVDNRLLAELPHYDGYEWRQAGSDMVLVTISTGLIYEVLHDVFD